MLPRGSLALRTHVVFPSVSKIPKTGANPAGACSATPRKIANVEKVAHEKNQQVQQMNAQIETSKADAGKEAEKNRQLTVTVGISFLRSPKYTASHWRLLATHGRPHHDNHTKERPSTPNVVKRRRTRHKPKTKARRIGPTNTSKKQAAKRAKNATWPFPTIQLYDVTLSIYVNAFCVSVVLRIWSMGQKRKTYSS